MTIIQRAKMFATGAHASAGQKRKYTGSDYIVHPASVAATVAALEDSTPEMVAAAWLHDVVEDTEVTFDQILLEFGAEVCELVKWLTNVSTPEDGARATRKALDVMHSSLSPAEAQTIKLADILDNTRDINEYDPGFAAQYVKEKRAHAEALVYGNANLRLRVFAQLDAFESAIGNTKQKTRT